MMARTPIIAAATIVLSTAMFAGTTLAGGYSGSPLTGHLQAPAAAVIHCSKPLRDLDKCPRSDTYWGFGNWPANLARSHQIRGKLKRHRVKMRKLNRQRTKARKLKRHY